MQVTQTVIDGARIEPADLDRLRAARPSCLVVFGAVAWFADPARLAPLFEAFPTLPMVGCSTAGEISASGVTDGSLCINAVHFDRPAFRVCSTYISGMEDSAGAGERLGRALAGAGLHAALVFGQGVKINGSALIAGIRKAAGPRVLISGGLAGDGGEFRQTWALANGRVSDRSIVALALYDPALQVRHGSFGGWTPFGPVRRVTRAAGNLLLELDGEPALEVYKRHLGEHAKGLPGTGLLFPFAMRNPAREDVGIIRTILGVDEARGRLILAGEVEEDGYLQLMHATTDGLVDGARQAAALASEGLAAGGGGLAVLVSCVGRKLAMAGRVDEEVSAVARTLGQRFAVTGFYSNGEISPHLAGPECHLHNQTMTITLLTER